MNEDIKMEKEHLRYIAAREAIDNGRSEQQAYAALERDYDRALGNPQKTKEFLKMLKNNGY